MRIKLYCVLVSSFIDIIKHYRNRKMNSKDWRYQQLAITAVLQKLGRRTWNTVLKLFNVTCNYPHSEANMTSQYFTKKNVLIGDFAFVLK
jgi:hypothetical protein